jgi:hypothetical protein
MAFLDQHSFRSNLLVNGPHLTPIEASAWLHTREAEAGRLVR